MTQDPSLSDVVSRREEIAQEIKSLIDKVERLRAEDERLQLAASVLQSLRPSKQDVDEFHRAVDKIVEPLLRSSNPHSKPKETMVDVIVQIMRNSSDPWWTAAEIRKELSLMLDKNVPQTSVSPKLTKMKDDGLIVRDGMRIALKERAKADPEFDLEGQKETAPPQGGEADVEDVPASSEDTRSEAQGPVTGEHAAAAAQPGSAQMPGE